MIRINALLLAVLIVFSEAKSLPSLLKSVQNNHTLHMKYRQQPFLCKPYGVQTLSELKEKTTLSSTCRKMLSDFSRQYPQEKYFALSLLKIEQQYGAESKKGSCLLHLSSEYTYSEALLENGYALIWPEGIQDDEVLLKRFKKALRRAKNTKAGIWSDDEVRNCFQPSLN